ncbi:MAG: DUF721 domain-containing protein [Lentisphaeria bacterium]
MPPSPDNSAAAAPDPHWLRMKDCADRTGWHRHLSHREHQRLATVGDWFGSLATAEILQRQPPARAAAEVVEGALARLKPAFPAPLLLIQGQWATLVGPEVARQTRPAAFRDGQLFVEVANATWLYVLETMHKPLILKRLQAASDGAIRDLRFLAGDRPAPSRPAAPRSGKKPTP